MPVAKLIREQTIGETRWAALDGHGDAVALYVDRPFESPRRAEIGDRLGAHVRRLEPALNGAFVDLGAKGEAFLRLKPGERFAEGAAVTVEVVAESRRNKLARVRLSETAAPTVCGAARWRAALTGGSAAPVEDRLAGDAELEGVFEDAMATTVALPGGGRLQAERNEALIAADIDTAGRAARGGRAAASLAINLEAATALARQIHLRGWGGLAVLDCVAPVDKEQGGRIRTAFLDAFRDISSRQVKVLVPSVFGLMEISADWQLTPLSERLLDARGHPSAETLTIRGLRFLEAEARANRMARLTLALPLAAFDWFSKSGLDAETRLAQTYGARFTILPAPIEAPDVKSHP